MREKHLIKEYIMNNRYNQELIATLIDQHLAKLLGKTKIPKNRTYNSKTLAYSILDLLESKQASRKQPEED